MPLKLMDSERQKQQFQNRETKKKITMLVFLKPEEGA